MMAGSIVIGYGLDQYTKYLAVRHLGEGKIISVLSHLLTLQLYHNPGAAFGMGTQFTIALSCLSLAVFLGLITVGVWKVRHWVSGVAVALLTYGVAGNLTDRLLRAPGPFQGHVVDFISLKGFAVFNVADIGITCAAFLLIVWALISERKK